MNDRLRRLPSENVLGYLEEAGVPAGPVHDVEQVLSLPQVQARESVLKIEHPLIPDLKVPGFAAKLSQTPAEVKRAPPLLGEHTDEVLEQMGYSSERIRQLKDEGVC